MTFTAFTPSVTGMRFGNSCVQMRSNSWYSMATTFDSKLAGLLQGQVSGYDPATGVEHERGSSQRLDFSTRSNKEKKNGARKEEADAALVACKQRGENHHTEEGRLSNWTSP